MSLWKGEGKTQSLDVRKEAIGFGTLGGEHAAPRSFSSQALTNIIDDTDSRISYGIISAIGASVASFTTLSLSAFNQSGTSTIFVTKGAGCGMSFSGTSIGVLAATNSQSGNMRIYIDGVATAGRVNAFTTPLFAGAGTPAISATDTTINVGSTNPFTSSGRIIIDSELIDYTGISLTSFTGCTRGVGGTTAAEHQNSATIYQWDSVCSLYNANNTELKKLVYYNPFLSPGRHTIQIGADTDVTHSTTGVWFDGFVVGSLVGAKNIFTQIGTVYIQNHALTANGHSTSPFYITLNSNDIAISSIVAYSQTSPDCEGNTANTMAKLAMNFDANAQPQFYFHNGPASTNINVRIVLAYIGESL